MAGIQNRTAAELKAELTAAIEQSRALLGETALSSGYDDALVDSEGDASSSDGGLPEVDYSTFTDEELDIILKETEPADSIRDSEASSNQGLEIPALDDLKQQIAKNPLPWVLGAVALGSVGARVLFSEGSQTKNPRQNASQSDNSAITHGSLMGQMMKTGLEIVQPALHEAVQGWLTRFVEKKH